MDIRPHRVPEDDLDAALFARVVQAIPARPIPDLGASVLRRLDALDRQPMESTALAEHRDRRRSRFATWLVAPQPVSLAIRPVYALAAAVVLLVAMGAGFSAIGGSRSDGVAVAAADRTVLVHFKLDAPHARMVALTGDFNDWSPEHTMQRATNGSWTIVIPLTPGVHEYAFIIDGEKWVLDPAAPAKPDGFGGMNSRVAVLGPDQRS